MKRLIVSIFIPLLAMLSLVSPAYAGKTYCKSDPVVKVGHRTLDVQVGTGLEYAQKVSGDILMEVQTPPGVEGEVIIEGVFLGGMLLDQPFGFDITFTKKDNDTIKIVLKVPMALDPGETAPVELTVTQLDPNGVPLGLWSKMGTNVNVMVDVP